MSTLSTSRISRALRIAARGPGAEAINAAYAEFCDTSVRKALVIGQMLREQSEEICGNRQNNQHTKAEETFGAWLDQNCAVPRRTAFRWMELAERSISAALGNSVHQKELEAGAIEVSGQLIPFSTLMTTAEADLPPAAWSARQLLFDFVEDKTMKECLAQVIVEGKEAHSVTRAHNGKTKGGAGQQDRKAFATFTATKLQHITTFVNSNMPPAEQARIMAAAEAAVKNWPKWFLECLVKEGQKELKLSDTERAARKGEML